MSTANNSGDFPCAGPWETNRALLNKHYPGLLEEILKDDDIPDILTEKATSGDVTLKIRGIYIHSNRDPVREGQRLAESVDG